MERSFSSVACLLLVLITIPSLVSPNNKTLSRKKRFLVFPSNSLLTLSACLAKGGIILSPPVFVFTFDWDLTFQLPNDTSLLHRFSPAYHINRRERRDLYLGMESLLEKRGFNGRACVLRALCEAQTNLVAGDGELMQEIFHAMFTLPPDERKEQVLAEELRDHEIANVHGRANRDCSVLYSECPISLLDLALW